MRVIFALLIATGSLAVVSSLILASAIPQLHRCSRQQAELHKCIKRSIESLRPYLASGISYLNIPPFEPLRKEHYEFTQHNAVFNGTAKLTDLMMYGVSNFTISNVECTVDVYQIRFEARFPFIQIFGIYDINAVFMGVRILRSGHNLRANFTNTIAKVNLDGEYYRKTETKEEHFRVNYMDIHFNITHSNVYLSKIDLNDVATNIVNKFLNNNLQIMLGEIMPVVKIIAEDFFVTIANNIYWNFPTKSLFPQ
ncbi:PREDICTED: uncharacterized protein LOC106742086 [Dinoponera quadriceps]|uniref:Uncharacterized protein LOC106742086 n=1 Tax=Dinoponera quadriceps TaxID=609295 RepID=A0A6P3WVX5_DINQU|nr:PREDICTED: uncharacterized protein LOC106742086 [Dinoponera quadriceps]